MDRFEKAGQAFTALCRTMATLRAPDGCPWDREQTLETLKTYLLEETYETLDAIESGLPAEHCEELGDLLLQVVFQSEIAQETELFDISEVCDGIRTKLVRRHPHIFSDGNASTSKEVSETWEEIKAKERKGNGKERSSVLDGLPRHLPALLKAYRTGEKAAGIGFDWEDESGPLEKYNEEWGELHEALKNRDDRESIKDELGDVFFSLVNYSRHIGLDPEDALRGAIDKFHQRFRHVEHSVLSTGKNLREVGIDRLNVLWEDAKRLL